MTRSISQCSQDALAINSHGADVMFVRSQSQLAIDNPSAKGHRLTREQAELAFGRDLVERALEDGVVSLVRHYSEPATTLKNRREELGLQIEDIARVTHLPMKTIADAETPGKIVPIQALNEICQTLALDESVLSYVPAASGDHDLGVRLRLLSETKDEKSFSATTVAKLAEAAWVVAKQSSLSEVIGRKLHQLASPSSKKDPNYSYPTYEKGYILAEKTRALLGLSDEDPISSVRLLIEETLNIPLIQTKLDAKFAGATISTGTYRGIVVNERGHNSDVAVRRMTMCHELAHLLWDPDSKLDKLVVDEYDDIEGKATNDKVEMRANSFAVSFLAPRKGVETILKNAASLKDAIQDVSRHFGISLSAARYHVGNVCDIDTRSVAADNVDLTEWIPAENLTIDYIPGLADDAPISRRGMFSAIVARAALDGKISKDTAIMCLKSKEIAEADLDSIANLWGL